jgi:hypothetical protein
VLGDPDARHVEVPKLVRSLDPEEAGTAPPAKRLVTLQQPLLTHHPLRAFPVDLAAELLAHERSDHTRPICRVVASDVDDQLID